MQTYLITHCIIFNELLGDLFAVLNFYLIVDHKYCVRLVFGHSLKVFYLSVAVSNGSSPSAAVAPCSSTASVTSTNMPVAAPATLAVPPSSTALADTVVQVEPKANTCYNDPENKLSQTSDSGVTECLAGVPMTLPAIPRASMDLFERFDWKDYMKQTKSVAAPSPFFKQVRLVPLICFG